MNSNLMNFVLLAVMIYMLVRMMVLNKRQKKNKVLIDCVNAIKDEDTFFNKIDNMISTINDPEFETKGRVLKLWGMAYHQKYENFEETLAQIDMTTLMKTQKGSLSIDLDEDSFFYMYLAIPNLLHNAERDDLREKIEEKMKEYDDKLQGQLVREISLNIDKYYAGTEDKGLSSYEKVLNGDYGEYTYSRTMIGIYKSIVNAMAAELYKENGRDDKYQEAEEMLKDFYQTGVGKRWINGLGLQVEEENDTIEADAETAAEEIKENAPEAEETQEENKEEKE